MSTRKPAITITVLAGESYLPDLKGRLERYEISQGELAREMGVDKSYISRMFNKGMIPRSENIEKIEKAIIAIRRSRAGTKSQRSRPSDD